MEALYFWSIGVLVLLVVYGLYRYLMLTAKPQKKHCPLEISADIKGGDSDLGQEQAEEISYFPPWGKKVSSPEPELPTSYNKNCLVLMLCDPNRLYAYWEITATKQESFKQEHGLVNDWHNTRPALRVYDITTVTDFDGTNAHWHQDILLNWDSMNWFFEVKGPDRTYCVDYGYMLQDGRFVPMLRSNSVHTPRVSLSNMMDEEWLAIEGIYNAQPSFGISSPMLLKNISSADFVQQSQKNKAKSAE